MNDIAFVNGALLDEIAALLAAGDLTEAMELAEKGVGQPDHHIDAICALAAMAFRTGQQGNALRLLELALDETAATSDIPELLAVMNCLVGRLSEALYYGKLAVVVVPDGRLLPLFGPSLPAFAEAFRAIGEKPLLRQARAMMESADPTGAVKKLEQHLELFANDVESLDLLAEALMQIGQARKAIGILRTVLTLAGPSATLLSRLGGCLTAIGELEDALACHREAVARAPKAVALHAALLIDWSAHPHGHGRNYAAAIAALRQALTIATPKTVRKPPPAVVRDRLRIGYLCAGQLDSDTRAMVARVAMAHDRAATKVIGFGCGMLNDPANLGFRGAFDEWRDVSKVDELTLATLIRGEGVDVTVDVDGLTGPSHLGVFARNCAPLQLSWLNIPEGYEAPGAHASLASANLPAGPLLLPSVDIPPRPIPDGPVTFGADCSLSELNAEVTRVWSAILHAVPDASLILIDRGLTEPEAVDRLIQRFGNFGVAHRIDVISAPHARDFFAEVDVALAPFPLVRAAPYGTALALGLPVVALPVGQARLLGGAIAAAVADPGPMVAEDAGDYVAKAVRWAEDAGARTRLAQEAATVRISAPFSDRAFAAGLETYFREAIAARADEQP